MPMEELTLRDLLEALDGRGLTITNLDLVEELLEKLDYTLDSTVRDNES